MRRRLFLGGLVAAIAAPAIVARENIMAIKVARPDDMLSGTITGLQMLWQAERDWTLTQRFYAQEFHSDSWVVVHPDEARLMRIGVDHGRPEGDMSARFLVYDGRISEIDRFTIYESAPIMDPGRIVASNYGRGPGLLTEDEKGVRQWRPQSTAQEIRAKIARAERQLRANLEPKGSARWR